MGINISENVKISSGFSCNKCCILDSFAETSHKINNPINDSNNNNIVINNLNNFEVQDKINSLYPEQEKIFYKNKLKKLFFEKNLSSLTNSSKSDITTLSSIQIQSYVRGYLLRKKLSQQKIIFNKLNNIKEIKEKEEKDSEDENIDIEDSLALSISMNGTIFTGDNSCKSSLSINSKLNKLNSSRILINKNILSFNLKSKNNIKYKYYGFLTTKNNNKQNFISASGIVKNSIINDKKIKNGFGKLIFEDNSVFKCHFIDNKANGIGQYIDKMNNEEFIGEYKNNIPNGYGIYRNIISERKCIGYFKINGLSGIGIEESIEDGYTYYGEFEKNQKNGFGKIKWKEGIIYEGQFYQNQMKGYAIIKYSQNKIYKGQMNNGKMEGFGEFDWGGGKKYIGYYKNDKRNGFGIFLWNIPRININEGLNDLSKIKGYIGFWNDGNMNGVGLKISDGRIKYGVWKNGVKMEWIEEEEHLKKYIKINQAQYSRIFFGKKQNIINLLTICATYDKENLNEEIEFEVN